MDRLDDTALRSMLAACCASKRRHADIAVIANSGKYDTATRRSRPTVVGDVGVDGDYGVVPIGVYFTEHQLPSTDYAQSMKCYEIFSKLTPELADEIFGYLQQDEKAVYKAMIQNIAARRKLRPVFLERKPRSERHLWLHDALGRKPADDITAQVFQIWLLGAQREMICQFLDGLGIAHDGKGVVEDLPSEPSKEILEGALSKLLEKHRPEIVTAYLHVFQAMDDHGWPTLDEILKTDQRLAFR